MTGPDPRAMTGRARRSLGGRIALAALAALAGCSQILGIEDFRGSDGPPPPPFLISGVVRGQMGAPSMPLAGVQLDFFQLPLGTQLASTLSNANGFYTLEVPSSGPGVEGYVRAAVGGPGFYRTYHYLKEPVSSDTVLDLIVLDVAQVDQVANMYSAVHSPSASCMFLQVFTAFGMPLQGASIQITPPEPVRYDDVNGFPSPNATVTGPVGTGYVFDGPVGVRLTVSASAPLQSFVPITTPPTESASVHIISLRSTR